MALEMAQLDCFRVSSHNASACQQGAMNPRFGFADVVPLPTLHVSLLVVVHTLKDMYYLSSVCIKACLKSISLRFLLSLTNSNVFKKKEGQCTHVLKNTSDIQ